MTFRRGPVQGSSEESGPLQDSYSYRLNPIRIWSEWPPPQMVLGIWGIHQFAFEPHVLLYESCMSLSLDTSTSIQSLDMEWTRLQHHATTNKRPAGVIFSSGERGQDSRNPVLPSLLDETCIWSCPPRVHAMRRCRDLFQISSFSKSGLFGS